jgi:formylglycine-generating enzyme required for sulfatase activity
MRRTSVGTTPWLSANWLGKKEGKPYRLPTEAEWEFVLRAGSRTPFSSGVARPAPQTA